MRTLIGVVAAAGLAGAIGFGLNFATSKSVTESSVAKATLTPAISFSVSKATTTPAISIWEIHNQAHLEFLPTQEIEDYSLIFTEAEAPNPK